MHSFMTHSAIMPTTKMHAIKTPTLGTAILTTTPIPPVTLPGHALLRTSHVAVNPCDYLFTDAPFMFHPNITIGCDLSGTVVALHPDTSSYKRPIALGDRLAGCVFPSGPCMPDGGAFAEYVLVKADVMMRVDELTDGSEPEDGMMQKAAALGVALTTAFVGLYWEMGFPLPELGREGRDGRKGDVIFVYGGSTCAGMMATQWAKMSGLTVLTTCSPGNFEMVRGLGANGCFDYHDADGCVEEVKRAAREMGQEVSLVFDCIGIFDAPKICAAVLAEGGVYNSIAAMDLPGRDDVRKIFTAGEKAIGEPFVMAGETVPADKEMHDECARFLQLAERYLREGKLKFLPVQVSQGWKSVLEKMQELREWKTSGIKHVCSVTPEWKDR